MTTNDDPNNSTREPNPGLEHDQATPEGELMTAEGSTIRDSHRTDSDMTLEDNPGLEHDDVTEAGRVMTASGSSGPEEDDAQGKRANEPK